MMHCLEAQYNQIVEEFIKGTSVYNSISRKSYYRMLDFDLNNKRVLDIGCGDGYDLSLLTKRGAEAYGIDASKEMVRLAHKQAQEARLAVGSMERLPYIDGFFDAVLSKYALQTSTNVFSVLKEMDRVLKIGGILAYLTVHPLRQVLEKKKHPKDYFSQEVVDSAFFGGSVIVREPTHTMNEYLNQDFLRRYQITYFKEEEDFPSSEMISGDTYPCFFVLRAKKLF